ncbi:hypothetical protein DNTS_016457 [Danionella cerebrum]|uniref:Uncharacterized protein n=1 Tax=Danionella cerebrum TaxID=2873325 RepID=A0A553R204_9TELE|nr:hypothetical protein DNTS_016457 [Danionella translucida]
MKGLRSDSSAFGAEDSSASQLKLVISCLEASYCSCLRTASSLQFHASTDGHRMSPVPQQQQNGVDLRMPTVQNLL